MASFMGVTQERPIQTTSRKGSSARATDPAVIKRHCQVRLLLSFPVRIERDMLSMGACNARFHCSFRKAGRHRSIMKALSLSIFLSIRNTLCIHSPNAGDDRMDRFQRRDERGSLLCLLEECEIGMHGVFSLFVFSLTYRIDRGFNKCTGGSS